MQSNVVPSIVSFIILLQTINHSSKNHMDRSHNTHHIGSSLGYSWRQQGHLILLQYIFYPTACTLNKGLVDEAWLSLVHPDRNLLHPNPFLLVHPKINVRLLKVQIDYNLYFWTYELIWEHTCLTSLTLSRLDLIIDSPCPGWSPCSTTGFWSAFKRSKPSLAPFFKSWWHPSTTSVALLLDINFRWIYNPFPFSSATIENCTFHNFSIIICQRNFSIWPSPSHFKISTVI